jgi:hypothetical protein
MKLVKFTALGSQGAVYVNPEQVVVVLPEKTASSCLHLSTGETLIVEGANEEVVKTLTGR